MSSRTPELRWFAALSLVAACLLVTSRAAIVSGVVYDRRAEAVFGKQMCDARGVCGETPDVASPRTPYSTHEAHQLDEWQAYHGKLVASAQAYAARAHEAPPLVFVGDSITESWVGTGVGKKSKRARGVPKVLSEFFAPRFQPLILAISGDQTQHVLWRLANGELPRKLAEVPDAVFVVLIGTNNLGAGHTPNATARGVLAVVEALLRGTAARIVLQNTLPRGDKKPNRICPPRCDKHGQPLASWLPSVEALNSRVAALVEGLEPPLRARVELVDCGARFAGGVEGDVRTDLMPDSLHPNAQGHRILAECLLATRTLAAHR
ncbi:SGNH hydrolase-type esterase domain-containing protein [Pelagophyceae sp. CCMP2097]|nr:SGNH hydrolase-type esterase domain-containing protein [Pelagophyceae sp. CCMP2097]